MAKKAAQNARYRLSGTYERLRRSLLERPDDGRIDKPLAYWVLPTDKRLPIAFLDQPLRDLLSRPIEELMATPGVGHKKILGFFDLLRRAAKANLSDSPFGMTKPGHSGADADDDLFDPASVSEALWATWCETVNRFGFRDQPLGRLASSLQSLPTVIWWAPLGSYADLSLSEIRNLKTHGSKRVGAILDVFRTVHEAASVAVLPETIDLCLAPRFVGPVTRWLLESAGRSPQVSAEEVHQRLIEPLVRQTGVDLGSTVGGIAADRLIFKGDAPTVKQQAEALGVTRARVYQLLEDCARAMEVRWPEGRWLIPAVLPLTGAKPLGADPGSGAEVLIRAVHDLYYPEDRQSSDSQLSLGWVGQG